MKGTFMEIEVFRAGTFADSNGKTREYSIADLEKIADTYNKRLQADSSNIAPVVKGHPKDNAPALAWTSYLKCEGDKLIAGIRDVDANFMQELEAGRYKKISISLFPDLMLRHIGFLGAATPAVSGLEPADFIESYSNTTLPVDREINYAKEMQEMKTKLLEYQRDLAEYQRNDRIKEYKDYCQNITKASSNNALNEIIEKEMPEIMNLAYTYDEYTNSEGKYLQQIKNFAEKIARTQLLASIADEINTTPNAQNTYSNYTTTSYTRLDNEKLHIHNKAMEIINSNPKISYEQALDMINQ